MFVNSAIHLRTQYVAFSEATRILQSLHHRAGIHGIECLSSAKCSGFVEDVVCRLGSKWSCAMILLGTWRAWAMQGFILAGGTRDLINHGEQIVERPESLEDMPGPRRKEKRSPRPYKTAWAPTPKLGIGPNFVRISTRPKPEKKS